MFHQDLAPSVIVVIGFELMTLQLGQRLLTNAPQLHSGVLRMRTCA